MKHPIRSTALTLAFLGTIAGGALASNGIVGAQTSTPQPTSPTTSATTTTSSSAVTAVGIPTPPASSEPAAPVGGPPAPPAGGPAGGPPAGGPGAVDGTQEGAARKLNEAYNDIARYQQLVSSGTVPDVAKSFATTASSLYTQALTAYNAKTYTKAAYFAEASKRATSAAKHAVNVERGTTTATATGIPTPPAVSSTDSSQEKAARELNHAYKSIAQAQAISSTDQTVTTSRTAAETLYKAASSDYSASKFDQAKERAQAAKDAADVAVQLSKALASQS